MRMSRRLISAVAVVWLAWPSAAGAKQEDDGAAQEGRRALRIGAIGGVGFPHPLAVEPMIELGEMVAIGVEYAVLPTLNIDNVQTSLWSLSGDARFLPFRRIPFFLGLRTGRQHVHGDTTLAVAGYGSRTETLDLDSWFLNPRLGFLWTSRDGFTIGVDAGVQIPLSWSTKSSLPLTLAPSAQQTADTLGSSWLPTVDLLRIGLLL